MTLKKVFSLEEKSFVEKIKIVQQWYIVTGIVHWAMPLWSSIVCDRELEKYRVTSSLDQLNAAVITTR